MGLRVQGGAGLEQLQVGSYHVSAPPPYPRGAGGILTWE